MDVTKAIKVARMSDVGLVREHNEDVVASNLNIGLIILADGMGGYKAGELASEIAVLTITSDLAQAMYDQISRPKSKLMPESEMLFEAASKANASIFHIAKHHPQCEGMGTTLVAGVFTDNKLVIGHIGDSRAYRLRNQVLVQLTEDHSLLQEQLNAGEITLEQARRSPNKHLLTRALGTDPFVELELNEYETEINDVYLLCSDGLTDLVSDDEIQIILLEAGADLDRAAANLVTYANKLGGKDNVSVIVSRVEQAFPMKRKWLKSFLISGKSK